MKAGVAVFSCRYNLFTYKMKDRVTVSAVFQIENKTMRFRRPIFYNFQKQEHTLNIFHVFD